MSKITKFAEVIVKMSNDIRMDIYSITIDNDYMSFKMVGDFGNNRWYSTDGVIFNNDSGDDEYYYYVPIQYTCSRCGNEMGSNVPDTCDCCDGDEFKHNHNIFTSIRKVV